MYEGVQNLLLSVSQGFSIIGLQDGSDTICHGVDTLNTETQEVMKVIMVHIVFVFFFIKDTCRTCLCRAACRFVISIFVLKI